MLNISITALNIKYLLGSSPLLNKNSFKIFKCSFQKSTISVFSNFLNAQVKLSSFSHFLQTPILQDDRIIKLTGSITDRQSYSGDHYLLVSGATFSNIISTLNGAAIYVDCEDDPFDCNIENSQFYNCSTQLSGCAIFFRAREWKMNYTCAKNCVAQQTGQFFTVETRPLSSNSFVKSAAIGCSTGLQYTTQQWSGIQVIEYINISSSSTQSAGAGILSNHPQDLIIQNVLFSHLNGKNVLCLFEDYYATKNLLSSQIFKLNFVNNTVSDYGLICFTGNWSIKESLFASNIGSIALALDVDGTLTITNSYFDISQPQISQVTFNQCTFSISEKTLILNSMPPSLCTTDDSDKSKVKTWVIVVSVVGGVVFIVIVAFVGYYIYKKRKVANYESMAEPMLNTVKDD